jgi:hypothetical protein
MAKKSKTTKKLLKRLEKVEKQADDLRSKAEAKGLELTEKAVDKFDELRDDGGKKKKNKKKADEGGNKGKLLLLLAAIGGAVVALKRKRDQELDEALWEEPRSI